MTGLVASMSLDAAAQFLIADAIAEERGRQIRAAVVGLFRLTAAAGHVNAESAFGARRGVTNRVARMRATVQKKTAFGLTLDDRLLAEGEWTGKERRRKGQMKAERLTRGMETSMMTEEKRGRKMNNKLLGLS